MQAIILAGGAGTRLRSLISDVPKSMAPVAGRPFLEYLLHQLRRDGFTRVVLCAGHLAPQLREHFELGLRWGVEIEYSVEQEPLGTGGALRLALPMLLGDRWLVMNGDSLFDVSLAGLVATHRQASVPATLGLVRVEDAGRYGSIETAADGAVTAFVEKADAAGPGLVNGGLYVIERSTLELIPEGRPASLEREVLPRLVGRGLRGVVLDGFFIDIGVPHDYLRAERAEAFRRLAQTA